MSARKKPDNTVPLNDGGMKCLGCGAKYFPTMPCPISIWVATAKAFSAEHRRCTSRNLPPPTYLTVGEWLAGDDTGMSSKFIAHVLLGGPRVPNRHPVDPDDLGRCIRLLDAFPAARARIGEMAEHGPVWRGFSDSWGYLEMLFREEAPSGEAPRCYARMQEIRRAGGSR